MAGIRKRFSSDEIYIFYEDGYAEGTGTKAELMRIHHLTADQFRDYLHNRKKEKLKNAKTIYPFSEFEEDEDA